jgi:plasmid stabilization system protein ParE
MKKPEYSDTARADLTDISRYISRNNPVAARRFVDELTNEANRIAYMPELYRERPLIASGSYPGFGDPYRTHRPRRAGYARPV